MALIKYKFGDFIQQRREKYNGNEYLPSWGVSKEGFIRPKQDSADTSIYNVFYKHDFVFNPARMELNSIALNTQFDKAICSSLYEIFYVTRPDIVMPEYLNLFIKRDEFARKCWFEAIGSARNYFRVANLSEFEIELPPLHIQQKYVEIYKAMLANQQSYESGLDDLKFVCDSTVEDFKKRYPIRTFGQYIRRVDERNTDNKYRNVKNVSVTKEFSEVSSKVNKNELSGYKLVKPRQITFVQTTHNEHVFCNAFNNTDDIILVTSVK